MIAKLFWVVVVLVAGFVAYVRVAPFDPLRWHVASKASAIGDTGTMNTFEVLRGMTAAPADILTALDRTITNTARTTRVSGSVAEEMVTYQTRSLLFGYPDYTTVSIVDVEGRRLVSIHGRARFGKSDINQNAKRIKQWVDAMGPLLVSE